MLQALNSLTTTMAGAKSSLSARYIDHSYVTPTIIGRLYSAKHSSCCSLFVVAVGDFPDDKAEDLLTIAQGDPFLLWNLRYLYIVST